MYKAVVLCAYGVSALQSVNRGVSAPRAKTVLSAEDASPVGKYCASESVPERRSTSTVDVGPVKIGSDSRIVLQTMGTTDTNDVRPCSV